MIAWDVRFRHREEEEEEEAEQQAEKGKQIAFAAGEAATQADIALVGGELLRNLLRSAAWFRQETAKENV